ncbi:phage/plasmid primase, P4 family [Mesorhizobium sp. M0129]|uniref:DNA primase family protein n=1 Tax=Mesorhizobium sp. M0129 TaxID=2956886 RepID=UPI00333D5A81
MLQTDAEYAKLFSDDQRGNLVFNGTTQRFYKKDNGIFVELPREKLSAEIIAAGLRLLERGEIEAGEMKKYCNLGGINNIANLSRAALYADHSLFDSNLDLVGCKNGVLSLVEGQIVDSGVDIVTKRIGSYFDPNADCPQFKKFLNQIMDGDQDQVDFFQRAMGYTLSGTLQEQCMFVLIGNGANGKSTFTSILTKLLGEYAGTTPMSTLTIQRYNNPASNDLAELAGLRFVLASESESSDRLAEAKIKSITGGEPITARRLRQNFFTYQPKFTIWLGTNELPAIRGNTEAIWRRLHIIEFPITIPFEQRDGTLMNKLIVELPGILNFALAGYRQWREVGLDVPKKIRDVTATYRHDSDTIAQFVEACCNPDPSKWEMTATLHAHFERWCKSNGIVSMNRMNFGKEMGRSGYEPHRSKTGNGWKGIKIR